MLAAAAFRVEAKQNSLKRQRTAETARMYNKARKSEIATRIKKVQPGVLGRRRSRDAAGEEPAVERGEGAAAQRCWAERVAAGQSERVMMDMDSSSSSSSSVALGLRCTPLTASSRLPLPLLLQVFVALEAAKGSVASEADLAPASLLLSEAYQVIDKAVSKGVLHKNTAARRKARLAAARRDVLIAAGLYTPALASA